jgi:2-methylcitrate dehydratase PrpD
MNQPAPVAAPQTRGDQLVKFVSGANGRSYPEAVKDAARQAFVDYLGVTVGSMSDAPSIAVASAVKRWNAPGKSTVFLNYRTAPALAALVNGTSTHSQDYDDTNPLGCGHPSGPCWSAALAMAEDASVSADKMLSAYITGYEVMAKLGGGGVGGISRIMQRKGFHPTSIFGRCGAAAVGAVMMDLDPSQIASALGNAATTAGGLLGSFGSHSKPFHAGKAAMDGIMAAQYAYEGFEASHSLFELKGGLTSAFVQDDSAIIPPLDDFGSNWEILGNGFKLFASCRATHASSEAAASLAGRVKGRAIRRIHAKTHASALVTAGKLFPKTPLEAKFSVPMCVAMALRGYLLAPSDFVETTMGDRSVTDLLDIIEVEPVVGQPPSRAYLTVTMEDGEVIKAVTDILKGHPDNPLSWDDLRQKFGALLSPVLSTSRIDQTFAAARRIDEKGAMQEIMSYVGARA